MAFIKQSFLSNLLNGLFGNETYDWLKSYAKIIVAIGTCVLCILIGLSTICHYSFVSQLVNLATGTSLIFIVYVLALVVLLDIEGAIEEPDYYYHTSKPTKKPKTMEYKLTIVWGVVLIFLGIGAIYSTNKYRKQYAFECSSFLVNHTTKVYHLDWDNDCEVATEASNLEKMKGYQINKSYTLCEWCEEWAEEAGTTYIYEHFSKE